MHVVVGRDVRGDGYTIVSGYSIAGGKAVADGYVMTGYAMAGNYVMTAVVPRPIITV